MTMSLQEISDRLELQDLVTQYADIIDQKAFSKLKTIFTDQSLIIERPALQNVLFLK